MQSIMPLGGSFIGTVITRGDIAIAVLKHIGTSKQSSHSYKLRAANEILT